MIALDTNVLMRFIVNDDEEQHERATSLIARAVEEEEPILLTDIVLVEAAWVLSFSYRYTRDEIIRVLGMLHMAHHVVFQSSDRLTRALKSYEERGGDFADYMIREHAQECGCRRVATFDRALLKDPYFEEP